MFESKRFWLLLLFIAAGTFVLAACGDGEEEPAVAIATPEPTPTPKPAIELAPPGIPRIAFLLEVFQPTEKGEIFLIGADGSGLRKLLEGEHYQAFGQCPVSGQLIYYSDEEIPNEQFLYIAEADGSSPQKVTEKQARVWCQSEDSVILDYQSGIAQTLVLHDLKSGQETTLLTDVDRSTFSPDRRRILFVSGLDYSKSPPTGEETLELLDLDTGERRRLDGPLTDRSYHSLQWSADGQRLGYLVGPPRFQQGPARPGDFELYVRDLLSGETKLVYRAEEARPYPWFIWSPSGSWLLVVVERGGPSPEEVIKAREEGELEELHFEVERERLLVNIESGEARRVATVQEGYYVFEWAPNEDFFAYATGRTLYLESVNGEVRQLATAIEDACQYCDSFGWSLDGRYIGLSDYWRTIAVLDTTTGEIHTLVQEEGEDVFVWPEWWR